MQKMWNTGLQRLSYLSLIALTFGSLIIFALHALSPSYSHLWILYGTIYVALLVINSWYVMYLLMFSDLKKSKRKRLDTQLISVIIPTYNERTELLDQTIQSVRSAYGNKQIIVVDDGSTNESTEYIKSLNESNDITLHRFSKNQGKREALHFAVTNLLDPSSFCVVTIDSDTILDKFALQKITEPLLKDGVGASTGNVLLTNERKNLLTRMVGTYYWMGLNIYKKAQSGIGNVVCCSGCLSAYKTDLLKSIIDEFNSQTFLGEKATHSEDRHLTNLILRNGHKIIYADDAICYTETPDTLRGFCRQQLRWKRGYVRESLYTLTYAWKNQKRLFFQILFWDLPIPYLTFGLRIYVIFAMFLNPLYCLLIIMPIWLLAMIFRYALVIMRAPNKVFGLFIYSIFFELILYWVNLYALFTVKNKRWVTR